MTFVQCPSLAAEECLIYDSRTVRLIVRRDFGFETDRSAGFARDVAVCRLIGRFAVGVPVANKAIRKLTIEGAAPAPLPAPATPAQPRLPLPPRGRPAEPPRATVPPAPLGPPSTRGPGPGPGHVTVVLPPARPGVTVAKPPGGKKLSNRAHVHVLPVAPASGNKRAPP